MSDESQLQTPKGLTESRDTVIRNAAGIVVGIGPTIDGKRSGIWREYYDDGTLMWEGEYSNDSRIAISVPSEYDCKLDFMDAIDPGLHIGGEYRFRIRNLCIHEDDLALAATKSTVKRLRDTLGYNFVLYPEKPEPITLMIFREGEVFTADPLCTFEIQVLPSSH